MVCSWGSLPPLSQEFRLPPWKTRHMDRKAAVLPAKDRGGGECCNKRWGTASSVGTYYPQARGLSLYRSLSLLGSYYKITYCTYNLSHVKDVVIKWFSKSFHFKDSPPITLRVIDWCITHHSQNYRPVRAHLEVATEPWGYLDPTLRTTVVKHEIFITNSSL